MPAGLREYAPAVEDLFEVARRGSHNGRIAAVGALKRMKDGPAKEHFGRLRELLGDSYAPYFG